LAVPDADPTTLKRPEDAAAEIIQIMTTRLNALQRRGAQA